MPKMSRWVNRMRPFAFSSGSCWNGTTLEIEIGLLVEQHGLLRRQRRFDEV